MNPKRLQPGSLVIGEVVGHAPWGVELRVQNDGEEAIGVVDLIHVTDERPFRAPDDYPPVGRQLEAVVLGYTPNGQLRLSTCDSDVDAARDRTEP